MTDLLESPVATEVAPVVTGTAEPPLAPRHRRPALLRGRGLVGLLLVGIVFVLGLAAPLIAPYGPNVQIAHANLLSAGGSHLFGTDQLDRDVFSRVLYGIRVDVLVVFVAVPVGALLGSAFGVLATTFRPADVTVQRIFDTLLAFPPIIFAIGLTAITGTGLFPVMVVVVAVEIPVFGRLLRTAVLRVRELPFVEASEVTGAGRWWVMRRHVLPNAAEPLFVQLALSMSVAIFLESAMSFLGIGVRPPQPSLGSIIADSTGYLSSNAMFAVGPLLVVAVLVLGFQLIAQSVGAKRRG
ncbi:ABC transporter permease [Jatrophihabitans endophyticus]|uniref:ABC transporter permease n=1 Tax=Jatrophihabitans endophyticus TaxID=1206085 RepID=UPI0019DB15CF|nr:ABC transporter permease [Jatrophihabitans endophyticus]MBE7187088.1 ABC transporter permease [Jatrophihabitans endophyticus]